MSTEPAAKKARTSRFAGQTILITGAAGTFGKLGSIMFAEQGANIVATDMNLKALGETEEGVKKVGGDIIIIECNVTNEEDVKAMVASAVEKFGKIDLLWNNAGYQGKILPTLEYPIEDFQAVMNVNVVGMFAVLKTVAAVMKENGGGVICNTASVAGLRGTPAMVAYASSKAAVMCMTVSTAKDLAPFNIRVNAISPALIGPGYMWDRQNELHAASGSPYFASDPEVVAQNKVNGVPLKRLGTTEEVIKSVMYLLSDDSSYTSATNLVVDGGMAGGLKA